MYAVRAVVQSSGIPQELPLANEFKKLNYRQRKQVVARLNMETVSPNSSKKRKGEHSVHSEYEPEEPEYVYIVYKAVRGPSRQPQQVLIGVFRSLAKANNRARQAYNTDRDCPEPLSDEKWNAFLNGPEMVGAAADNDAAIAMEIEPIAMTFPPKMRGDGGVMLGGEDEMGNTFKVWTQMRMVE